MELFLSFNCSITSTTEGGRRLRFHPHVPLTTTTTTSLFFMYLRKAGCNALSFDRRSCLSRFRPQPCLSPPETTCLPVLLTNEASYSLFFVLLTSRQSFVTLGGVSSSAVILGGVSSSAVTLGGVSSSAVTLGGVSSSAVTLGGVSSSAVTLGGVSSSAVTLGGVSSSAVTLGGVSSSAVTLGGVSSSAVTLGGVSSRSHVQSFASICSATSKIVSFFL
uniref:Uncharacterized protein n=1 Tax=Eptatretus burgeri TaxID=7764 RepID=A0A8C4QT31_EPTBU